MKTIIIFLASSLMTISALAQSVSTLTVNVKGNKTDLIIIDGKEYAVTDDFNSNARAPIVVSNLQAGQHTLQIRHNDQLNLASTTFTIRTGFDMNITIAGNGSVQLRESK